MAALVLLSRRRCLGILCEVDGLLGCKPGGDPSARTHRRPADMRRRR